MIGKDEFVISTISSSSIGVFFNGEVLEYNISFFRLDDNTPASVSDLVVGDFFISQNNYFVREKVKLKPIVSIKNAIQEYGCPSWIETFYPYIRFFQTGHRNIYLALSIRIVEEIQCKKDLELYCKLKEISTTEASKKVLKIVEDFFKFSPTSIYSLKDLVFNMDDIEAFGRHILSNKSLNEVCKSLNIQLLVYDFSSMKIVYHTEPSSRLFEFMDIYGNWNILYSNQNYCLMDPITKNTNFILIMEKFNPNAEALEKTTKKIEKHKNNKKNLLNLTYSLCEFQIPAEANKNKFADCIAYLEAHQYDVQYLKKIMSPIKCSYCPQENNLIYLNCTHIFCYQHFVQVIGKCTKNKLVLNDEEEKKTQINCEICYTPISKQIMKDNIINYNELKAKANSEIPYTCRCGFIGKSELFMLPCKHLCDTCAALWLSLNYKCCDINITKNIRDALSSKKKKCDWCKQQLNIFKSFGNYLCDHSLCYKCIEKSGKHCPIDKVEFYNYDRNAYLKFECSLCKCLYNKFDEFQSNKGCDCRICIDCQAKKSTTSCAKCNKRLEDPFPFILVEKKEQIEIRTKARIKKCTICEENWDIDEFVYFINCGHYLCNNCFKSSIEAYADSDDIGKAFKCSECQEDIERYQLQQLIKDAKLWDKINWIEFKKHNDLVSCPKCRFEFMPNDGRRVICLNRVCSYEFCKLCCDDFHIDSNCIMENIRKRIEDLENNYQPEDIAQCPDCKTPYLKDDHCDHLICKVCNVHFCFSCCCIRSPTLEHGNHYHRPICKYFSEYNGPDKFSDKCTECKKTGTLCKKPVNLKVPKRFSDGEV